MPDSNATPAPASTHFELGEACLLSDTSKRGVLLTHGVVVGMTGSGKTGLVTVLAEEALRAKVPCSSST
jgi:polynucleotide 5'-kinase involved in rRNA processing